MRPATITSATVLLLAAIFGAFGSAHLPGRTPGEPADVERASADDRDARDAPPGYAEPSTQDRSTEIPFELVRGRVHLPVSVNDRGPFDFLLDNGASGMGRLDDSLRAALGIPVVRQQDNFDGVNASPIDVIEVESLAVGPFVRRDVELLSRDYSVDGVLGADFFADDLLTIDYPGRVLRVLDGTLDETDPHVVSYDTYFEIPIRIGNDRRIASIDTGSTLTLFLPLVYADSLDTTELIESGRARRANTEFSLYRATLLEPVVIAGNTLTDLEVVFAESVPWINIGSGLLQEFAITFDQTSRRIRIAPAEGER